MRSLGSDGPLKKETIQVVVTCDNKYAPHLTVMLLSLFEQHFADEIRVHVIVNEAFTERAPMQGALGGSSVHVTFASIESRLPPGLKVWESVTVAVYYRLLLAELLPLKLDRVIYLDCDLVVRASLRQLWSLPLGGHVLGAVPDPGFLGRAKLGMSHTEPYFNSGVMLIDLQHWRRHGIGEAAIEFAAQHPERLSFGDQCTLNWTVRGRWLAIDQKWNMQGPSFGRLAADGFRFRPAGRELRRQTCIVHFTAASHPAEGKPWFYMCTHPLRHEYLSYLKRTPWAREFPNDHYPHNVVRKLLRMHLPFLHDPYVRLRRFLSAHAG